MTWPWKNKELAPDICQCSHFRCAHIKGVGTCTVDCTFELDKEILAHQPNRVWMCACQIFIPRNGEGKNVSATPNDEELKQLRKMTGIKEKEK